jgi:hypothetical protein
VGNKTDNFINLQKQTDLPEATNGVLIGSNNNDTLLIIPTGSSRGAILSFNDITNFRTYRFPDSSGTISLFIAQRISILFGFTPCLMKLFMRTSTCQV